jgi:hypothetical protein
MRQRVEGFSIDENAADGYPITVRARDLNKDEVFEVKTLVTFFSPYLMVTLTFSQEIPYRRRRASFLP